MNACFHALAWAIAVMGAAMLDASGAIPHSLGATLRATLPIVAVVALYRTDRCESARGTGQ